MKTICLIDGSGYIFRAFYGLPAMTAPDGTTPVNAVFGFVNMIMKLREKVPCDASLVLFDAARKNYRNDIYPEYKANRAETPPELAPQFAIIREAAAALNLDWLELEGFEADDLIATLAKAAREKDMRAVIVSADKDLMQLMGEGVELFDPMKDKLQTEEDVIAKFGVPPEKVVDVQALAGDSTDNIPGIPGIGLKTAAELIQQFGGLNSVLNRAGEIPQTKRRETILANRDKAEISLQLVRLKDDVPLDLDIEQYACRAPEVEKLKAFLDKYGFRSLRAKMEKWTGEPVIASVAKQSILKKYQLVQTESQLQNFVELIKQNRRFAFDTETTGFDPLQDKIVGMSLAAAPGVACYIPIAHKSKVGDDLFARPAASVNNVPKEIINQRLAPLFADPEILKIAHNLKFDMRFMEQVLGRKAAAAMEPFDDTSVMLCDLDSSGHGHGHGLDELAKRFLDYDTIKYEEVTGAGKNKISFAEVELGKALDYAAEDADITLRLFDVLKPRLPREKKAFVYEHIDKPLIPILADMEEAGIKVDIKALQQLGTHFGEEMRKLEKEIYALAGEEFNLASPKQIGEILFGKLGLKGKKSASGGFQTGSDVLEKLADSHELPAKILEWRGFAKLKSTYADALVEAADAQGRVHTSFNQIAVNTGRLASSNPNIQNIPIRTEDGRKIRACFVAAPGHELISADYSQVELRLLADIANVKALKEAFAAGADIHAATAAKVFGLKPEEVSREKRRDAKAINFGIVYGISQYGLAKQLNIEPAAAKTYIDNYFREMPEIREYMEKTIAAAKADGFVQTPLGRKIFIHGINEKGQGGGTSFAERAAINAPIQGAAADIIKLAMNSVFKKLREGNFKTRMLLQVHDELVFEAPESEVEEVSKLIKREMESAARTSVPLIVEVAGGDNWAQAH